MVKGISRRVIVVRSPDPRFFEQAIFLLKEDALHQDGVSAEQVVSEARQVAAGYVQKRAQRMTAGKRLAAFFPWWVWFLLGCCVMGIAWWISAVLV
ncbi:MAG: translation initiation factor 2 [Oscillospiraceae bacterium]|nr:translation initiation factor 2 [Oscillospiraceae bacterium]